MTSRGRQFVFAGSNTGAFAGGSFPITINNNGTQQNNQGDTRYKVVMGSGGGEAAAVYTNVDVGIKNAGWITAGNWTTALQTALAGSSLR